MDNISAGLPANSSAASPPRDAPGGNVRPVTDPAVGPLLPDRREAGFCLVANGCYIAFGPAQGAADTGVMIQHGSPRWLMVIFGLLTVPLGLYLWHRQGHYFGLGETKGKVNHQAAIISASLLAAIVGVELIINSR